MPAFALLLAKLVPFMFLVIAFLAVYQNIGIDFQEIMNASYLAFPQQ